MSTRTKIISLIVIVIVVSSIVALNYKAPEKEQPIATVSYVCNVGRTIEAAYYRGETKPARSSGQPPIPGGSVALSLSDGRSMTLRQTISADGSRYANKDESFIFWSKGNGALVLENNQEKNYIGCILIAPEPAGSSLSQIYANSSEGFSLGLPSEYSVDESYTYQELGPNKDIFGIKFTIPTSVATGTNLGADSYLSVEQIPQANPPAVDCSASLFLDQGSISSVVTEGNTTYSVASSTGAGAGNRYEETVYALPGTNPCVAVRYFIHYGVIENYPADGAVREFDKHALLSQFDAIRSTLIIVQ